MKSFLAVIPFVFLFLSSCQQSSIKDKIKNDEIIAFENDNALMNTAIQKAKDSFSEFTQAFENPSEKDEAHAIKVGFATPDNSLEHIWIGDLKLKDNQFSGIVNNEPAATKLVKLGDTVTINPENISDWMYLSNGILKGGYTIRVIRDQLTDEEKKDFDNNIGFIIK